MNNTFDKQQIKYLIVNADDFGLSASVNNGIIYGMKEGIVSSASLLMNMPGTNHALGLMKEGVIKDVGVHLNLTDGLPLGNGYKTLADNKGNFHSINSFVLRAWAGKIDKEEIKNEVSLQIEKFFSSGVIPTHIDDHMWIQIIPEVQEVILSTAKLYGIQKVRNIREILSWDLLVSSSLNHPYPLFRRSLFVSLFVSFNSRKSSLLLGFNRFKYPKYYYGIIQTGARNYNKALFAVLDSLQEGKSELMCHPGYSSEELEQLSFYTIEREKELEVLTSEELKDFIRAKSIQLISYAQL